MKRIGYLLVAALLLSGLLLFAWLFASNLVAVLAGSSRDYAGLTVLAVILLVLAPLFSLLSFNFSTAALSAAPEPNLRLSLHWAWRLRQGYPGWLLLYTGLLLSALLVEGILTRNPRLVTIGLVCMCPPFIAGLLVLRIRYRAKK